MSDRNLWEILHRLSTTYALAVAFCGGAAVNSFVRAALNIFGQPARPWWGDLCAAGILSALILWLLHKASQGASTNTTAAERSVAEALPEHPQHLDQVQHIYRRLRLQEKIALVLVYRNPRIDLNKAQERLSDYYFSGRPLDALTGLMNTNPKLVDTSDRSEVFIPPPLQEAVSEIIRREPPEPSM
jgi:hypothetical protein